MQQKYSKCKALRLQLLSANSNICKPQYERYHNPSAIVAITINSTLRLSTGAGSTTATAATTIHYDDQPPSKKKEYDCHLAVAAAKSQAQNAALQAVVWQKTKGKYE